ncbi:MAG: hypothetical protein J6S21_02435 [Victivallales bacterium]|nr:hypothetical protein [Victivallales bacterium]
MLKVLFVCSSDRTRAPMAAALFRAMAERDGLDDWTADSAGVHAQPGQMIAPEVRTVLNERNIPCTRIGVQLLTPKLIKSSELILCMTSSQEKEISKKFLVARGKVKTLMSVTDHPTEVFDPNHLGAEKFRQCLDMMWPAVQEVVDRLK